MPLSNLNEEEISVVGMLLKAAAYGPYFDDWEFHSLFGVSREEAQAVADRFPNIDEDDDSAEGNDDSWLVINNAFANLLGYPHKKEAELEKYVSASSVKIKEIFEKWRG